MVRPKAKIAGEQFCFLLVRLQNGGQPRLDFLFTAELTLSAHGIPDQWSPDHRVNFSHLRYIKANILDELNSA